ncbi:MAG TPA: M28 family peptidase [Gemmatimonadaceae bacterium]|nr:M28 family peptidase [Gemmatimonadaceae bacterium]
MRSSLFHHVALGVSALGAVAACTPAARSGGTPDADVSAIPATLPLTYEARPTTAAITAGDLMSRLYVFADDSMQGRDTGSPGHVKSTQWIADQLRALGLEPAGENGTFFQEVPMVARRLDATSRFGIEGRVFRPYAEYVTLPLRGTARQIVGSGAVYAGVLGDTARALPAAQLTGRVAVYRAMPGTAVTPAALAAAADARAIVLVADSLPAQVLAQARNPAVSMAAAGTSAAAPARATIYMTAAAAQALFDAPLAGLAPGTAGKTFTGEVAFVETRAPARNVVAVLRGADPALRNTYVALGAHNDHVGYRVGWAVDHDSLRMVNAFRNRLMMALPENATREQLAALQQQLAAYRPNLDSVRALRSVRRDSIFNGADDDGSGSVGLLEIAEAAARAPRRPRRSLLFVWHTGEEKGLLGSRWFSEHPTVPRDSIIAQLNIDMIGRGGAEDIRGGGPNYLQVIGARRLSSQLGTAVEQVNAAQPTPFALDYSWDAPGHPQNIYCRSDHYHYARWGIPVAFLWTGTHGDYHQVTDEPQYIDYPHMARITRFVHDLALTLANRAARPVVDGVKLDPNGGCRQ